MRSPFRPRIGGMGSPFTRRGGSGSAPPGVWTPDDLIAELGLIALWDFVGPDTVFTDTAGTTPATAGQNVARYNMQTPTAGGHYVQATAASQPVYEVSDGVHYLQGDGVADFMVSAANLDLSGSDEITVIAAFEKLSDASAAVLLESSTSGTATAGTFSLFAPGGSGLQEYRFRSRGTVNPVGLAVAGSLPAPDRSIVTCLGKISSAIMEIYINGSLRGSASADQGVGNFTSQPIYMLSRGGASLFSNGRYFGSFICSGVLTPSQIRRIEEYFATRIGVVLA